jgi:hypothetical protein
MRPLARAAALAALVAIVLPGCIVAIDTVKDHDEECDKEKQEEMRDADEAFADSRLLELEERMDRLEQGLAK